MAITYNAKGTSYPSFTIGKNGPTIYQTSTPSSSNKGDINLNTSQNLIEIYDGSEWLSLLDTNTASNTYITKINPTSTGNISFDGGNITSNGSGTMNVVGLNINSNPVATQEYVSNAISSYNPLIGPEIDFGNKTAATDKLILAFYQSGLAEGNVSASDAQINIVNGTAGDENNASMIFEASTIDFSNCGTVISLTPPLGDSSTKIATTEFVQKEIYSNDGNYLKSVSQDTSPSLGGNLDVGNFEIESTSGNIALQSNGGFIQLNGFTWPNVPSTWSKNLYLSISENGIGEWAHLDTGIVSITSNPGISVSTDSSGNSTIGFDPSTLTSSDTILSSDDMVISRDGSPYTIALSNINSIIPNILEGPDIIYGSKTSKLTNGLNLEYFISGPASNRTVTSDAQITITNGVAGTKNQATFDVIANNIIFDGTNLTTTSSSIYIGNQTNSSSPIVENINFYLNGSTVADANISISGGVSGTEHGATIQINGATLDCSSTISNMTVPDVDNISDSSTRAANTSFVQLAKSSLNVYEVSSLPTGTEGMIAYASDGLKPGEVSGSGSGTPVFYDGTSWISFGSFQKVVS